MPIMPTKPNIPPMPNNPITTLPLDRLALHLAANHVPNAAHILQQEEGRRRMANKVPLWAQTPGIEYPPRLALEQCSGQPAAQYKARLVEQLLPDPAQRQHLVDLTGGLGVDFSFMAPLFAQATYVEQQPQLCQLAAHNMPLLALPHARIVNADATQHLTQLAPDSASLIFIDPARRSATGRKTVFIEDCQPDIITLAPSMLKAAPVVVVKLSTMLDIAAAVRALGCVSQVHIVATAGECKDLLLVITRQAKAQGGTNPLITAASLLPDGTTGGSLTFTPQTEAEATPPIAAQPLRYIYEPGPAIMKAGAFKTTALHYQLQKLHTNTHLYTASHLVPDFQGRTFELKATYTFGKAQLKALRSVTTQANLAVRNFPASVDSLRKRLKLRDGGPYYIFATTLADGTHALLLCERV